MLGVGERIVQCKSFSPACESVKYDGGRKYVCLCGRAELQRVECVDLRLSSAFRVACAVCHNFRVLPARYVCWLAWSAVNLFESTLKSAFAYDYSTVRVHHAYMVHRFDRTIRTD